LTILGKTSPAEVGHRDIQQDKVWQFRSNELQRLAAVARFPYHFHSRDFLDHGTNASTNQRMIVREQDADRAHFFPRRTIGRSDFRKCLSQGHICSTDEYDFRRAKFDGIAGFPRNAKRGPFGEPRLLDFRLIKGCRLSDLRAFFCSGGL
jgi:hypothetical protein